MPERSHARETSKRETREALLQAGIAEFAERGVVEPSLDSICARAGYTRGAFYVHFRNRDDFVSAVMERLLGAFLDAIIATGDEAHDLEHTIARFAAVAGAGAESIPLFAPPAGAERRLHFHPVLEAASRSEAVRGRFVELIEEAIRRVSSAAAEGQRSGSVRGDVDPGAVGTLLVATALGALSALEFGVRLDTEAGRDTVLALLRRRY